MARCFCPLSLAAAGCSCNPLLLLQAALEWALLLQSALLHMPWPEDILSLAPFLPEQDAAGRLLFRGPRVKVGVCSGTPKTILPDHLGRADYHGATINQAARWAAEASAASLLLVMLSACSPGGPGGPWAAGNQAAPAYAGATA